MFKHSIAFFITAIICHSAMVAQNINKLPAFSLRTNPLSFIENDGNFMLGLGVHFTPRFAITVEPGLVLYSLYDFNDKIKSNSGLKLRTDVRYFLRDFVPMGENRFIPFVALGFHYKNVSSIKTDDFGINCINGDCEYFQQSDYKQLKKEVGGFVKFGAVFPLSKSGRFNGEFFMGLGARTQKFGYKNTPLGSTVFFNPVDPTEDFPYVPLNDKDNPPTVLFPTGIKLFYFLSR